MSALGNLVEGAAGAVSGGLWKIVSVVLLIALLAVGGSTGFGWWLAARDRDQAIVDLKTEKDVTAELRVGIREQNRAAEALGKAKEAADARRALAEQVAAANGKRLDVALGQLAGARATTCSDAMPFVNKMLDGVRR